MRLMGYLYGYPSLFKQGSLTTIFGKNIFRIIVPLMLNCQLHMAIWDSRRFTFWLYNLSCDKNRHSSKISRLKTPQFYCVPMKFRRVYTNIYRQLFSNKVYWFGFATVTTWNADLRSRQQKVNTLCDKMYHKVVSMYFIYF